MRKNKRHNYVKRSLVGEFLESRRLMTSDLTGLQRIVGGLETTEDWPWMVSLQNYEMHRCGGSVIAPNAVLTAAHCVDRHSVETLSVVVGIHNLSEKSGQRIGVRQVIVHPQYDDQRIENDVAVLILESPTDAEPISLIELGEEHLTKPGKIATVIGWGTIRSGGSISNALREVSVPIVETAEANVAYEGWVSPNMLAAGRVGLDSCQGDSGGPLMVPDKDGRYELAGIVSWGIGCARPDYPGVYARVAQFSDWVAEAIDLAEDYRNAIAKATPIFVPGNDSLPANDRIRSFFASAGSEYRIQVKSTTLNHSTVTIRNEYGEPIANSQPGDSELKWFAVESGRCYVQASSANLGDVDLIVDVVNHTDEPDRWSLATVTNVPSRTHGVINRRHDDDVFKFRATKDVTYVIAAEHISLPGSVIVIRDERRRKIVQHRALRPDLAEPLSFTAGSNGIYSIEISGYFPTDVGEYVLSLSADEVFGDANLDGVFDSADLVQLFVANEFQDDETENSLWSEGDWNGDGEFDSSDLILAFIHGSYIQANPNPDCSCPTSNLTVDRPEFGTEPIEFPDELEM